MATKIAVKMIGSLDGSATLNSIQIFATSVQFQISNPLILLPIPKADNAEAYQGLSINLRRLTRKIVISGFIINSSAGAHPEVTDTSRAGVTMDDEGVVDPTSGTAVTSVTDKKYYLEQMAMAGSNSGKACTFQWRDNWVAGARDHDVYQYKVSFIDLTIEDNVDVGEPSYGNVPNVLSVKITLGYGTPAVG